MRVLIVTDGPFAAEALRCGLDRRVNIISNNSIV